jgi:NAD(P)-dependent dehydrogenase (short-subunit alcohol dehydrogenase family)
MTLTNLTNKVCVVTGAGSGIGRATALAFAERGARVVATDIDRERLDLLAAELGERALLVRAFDVSDRAQFGAFADAVHALAPAVDVVVNNAGVACGGLFLDTSLDDWDWLLGVNLRGVVHGCHFFAPKMVERGNGGHLVNVSSIFGIYPAPQVTAYVASKFAVLGFSQSLRAELVQHGIGVTAICPGMINTGIIDGGRMSGGVATRQAKMAATFRKRGASPSLVADTIIDALRTNPAVRTVGRDAWMMHQITRVAPSLANRAGVAVSKMFQRG